MTPLRERKVDLIFIGFLALNAFFITYIVDLEQLVVADPAHFEYPVWPPAPLWTSFIGTATRSTRC